MANKYKFDDHPSRFLVLDTIPENSVCGEIGVLNGDYAEFILSKNVSELHLIDPWVSMTRIPDRWHAVSQDEMDDFKENVVNRFSSSPNVNIIEKSSAEASVIFCDEYFDWLYLDADHSYSPAYQDLLYWWPKLKSGGLFCGNAYLTSAKSDNILKFGVYAAVQDFFERKLFEIKDIKIHNSQFIIEKK